MIKAVFCKETLKASKKDQVIPSSSIATFLNKSGTIKDDYFEEIDFKYPYTHENPFDANLNKFKELINESFESIMSKASSIVGVT